MPHDLDILRTVFRAYVNGTMAYGFTRAVTYDYKGTKRYYNNKIDHSEVKEMLLVDKISRITGGTMGAIFWWPMMMHEDLTRLECAIRGKDATEYE